MNAYVKPGYFILAAVLIASGCSKTMHLSADGEKVRVLQSSKKLPAHCKLVDKVSAFDTNGSTQSYQSHQHLVTDELNILRNKSADLGANTLVVTTHQQTYEGNLKNDFVDQHWMAGYAYRCPQ
ncbi:DUF4156 domain-containing protein [Legionella pneumophila]|uniref:DUF4156 domain-containing protein n=1 Tax=Legionella pneumophila TaxID=446 RepID=UPI000D057ABE|nr:DUF4156 domain-containing protein [Legionella pneumophila]HAT7073421.1 DUF4156 domain-containing protein [Legionella pneumophila]HAU3504137.1 DUF4156 domain-containing protein [Legionella pneumophila]HAU3594273.1 DUF4156 domain-containing protein [Legionella pneumophila]HAU3632935.1 DUF4156 domain-containing protein [Legionella pneumophila]HAU4000750.1 DUF4156 domain-containing protein [Legionella pneumophila]